MHVNFSSPSACGLLLIVVGLSQSLFQNPLQVLSQNLLPSAWSSQVKHAGFFLITRSLYRELSSQNVSSVSNVMNDSFSANRQTQACMKLRLSPVGKLGAQKLKYQLNSQRNFFLNAPPFSLLFTPDGLICVDLSRLWQICSHFSKPPCMSYATFSHCVV